MGAKAVIKEYYERKGYWDPQVVERLMHKDAVIHWHSSKGYLHLDKKDVLALATELNKSYSSSRLDISHILKDGNNVTVRYTHYVNAFENPGEEMVLAHFVVIWEVKDNQLYKGWLMSQLA